MKKVLILLVSFIGLMSCEKQRYVDPYIGVYEGTYTFVIESNANGVLVIDTTCNIIAEVVKDDEWGTYHLILPHGDERLSFFDDNGNNPNCSIRDGKIVFFRYDYEYSGSVDYFLHLDYTTWTPMDTVTIPTVIQTFVEFEGYKL